MSFVATDIDIVNLPERARRAPSEGCNSGAPLPLSGGAMGKSYLARLRKRLVAALGAGFSGGLPPRDAELMRDAASRVCAVAKAMPLLTLGAHFRAFGQLRPPRPALRWPRTATRHAAGPPRHSFSRRALSVRAWLPCRSPCARITSFVPPSLVLFCKQALERSGRSHGHGSVLRLLLHRLVHLRTRGPGASRQPIEEEEYNTRGSVCAIYPPPSSPQKRAWCVHSPLIRPSAPCRARPPPSLQLFMYTILNSGGEWYLGVSKEDAPAAAHACLIAAGVYGLYLVYCGLKLGKAPKAVKDDEEA
jgi:hypothetical protein